MLEDVEDGGHKTTKTCGRWHTILGARRAVGCRTPPTRPEAGRAVAAASGPTSIQVLQRNVGPMTKLRNHCTTTHSVHDTPNPLEKTTSHSGIQGWRYSSHRMYIAEWHWCNKRQWKECNMLRVYSDKVCSRVVVGATQRTWTLGEEWQVFFHLPNTSLRYSSSPSQGENSPKLPL